MVYRGGRVSGWEPSQLVEAGEGAVERVCAGPVENSRLRRGRAIKNQKRCGGMRAKGGE